MKYRPEQLRRLATQLHIPGPVVRRVKRLVESSGLFTPNTHDEPEWRWAGDGLRVATERPTLRLRPHDPHMDAAFIQERLDRRSAPRTQDDDDKAAIERQPWYHSIELPDGSVTEGAFDHRQLVPFYGIPTDLQGMRVLDVATADGFWAFEFERRGGDVTAVDLDSTDQQDLPPLARNYATDAGLTDSLADGFHLAHRLLGSNVRRVSGSVYNLDPDTLGRFDLVHAGDLLLHLRDPIRAIQQIRNVTGGFALLSDVFDPSLHDRVAGPGLIRYLGAAACWWTPSLATLGQMVADGGFRSVEVVTVYSLAGRSHTEGPWRVVLKATP